MGYEMGRLIIVPQYPTQLRYQEWWWTEFPSRFYKYFDDVIVLGWAHPDRARASSNDFAPLNIAIDFELQQMRAYNNLELKDDDVLLLNDLSFPGLFPSVLLHKRPKKCFAICHATSKNRYDYFAKDRGVKYPIEKATSKLFTKVFVASEYHRSKLKGWDNVVVQPFPTPSYRVNYFPPRQIPIISVARNNIQKRTPYIEQEVERAFKTKIVTPHVTSWESYCGILSSAKILLITSKEETYGYQVVDAIINGCIPVAPNHFSYPELISKDYLYNNIKELIKIMIKALSERLPVPKLLTEEKANLFYENIASYMI